MEMERAKSAEPVVSPDARMAVDKSAERPYAPSFVDRITDWVRRLPIPSWLFYLGLSLALVLLYSGAKWIVGSYPVGTFFPFHVLGVLTSVYAIALLHYLDHEAQNALDDFRATIHINDAEYRLLSYRFTTLPVLPTIIAAAIGGLYGLSSLLYLSPQESQIYKEFTSPLAVPLDLTFLVLGYAGGGVLIYHSVRQLRMVSRIYTDHAYVDLFNLHPMYALSRLAASTAVGLAILVYAWLYVNLSVGNGTGLPATHLIEPVVFTVIVIFIFILPLMGAHRLLHKEKVKAKGESSQLLKTTIAELHHRCEAGDFAEVDAINKTLDALQKEQTILDKISTWPWQPETLRGVVTAILLPIMVWIITHLLNQIWVF